LAETPGVRLLASSNVYDTTPQGGVAEHRFLNAAVQLQTTLEPETLLDVLQSVETSLGRTRNQRWEDRTMDLDLVLWGERIIQTPRLVVPHPELHRRHFVLAPAVDLAPQAHHPLEHQSLRQLLDRLPTSPGDCVRVGPLSPLPVD
jgi:2-amino-4-hydroxy-6-hydroxymethyldihydropteridine diphosphokinase